MGGAPDEGMVAVVMARRGLRKEIEGGDRKGNGGLAMQL